MGPCAFSDFSCLICHLGEEIPQSLLFLVPLGRFTSLCKGGRSPKHYFYEYPSVNLQGYVRGVDPPSTTFMNTSRSIYKVVPGVSIPQTLLLLIPLGRATRLCKGGRSPKHYFYEYLSVNLQGYARGSIHPSTTFMNTSRSSCRVLQGA